MFGNQNKQSSLINSSILEKLENINSNIELLRLEFQKSSNHINPTIDKMLDRFFKIFALHEIDICEIPLAIDQKFNISLFDISSKEALLQKITNDLLFWVSEFFSIEIEWLLGKSDYMYKIQNYDKSIVGLCLYINQFREEKFEFDVLKNCELDKNIKTNNYSQYVYPVIRVLICKINGKEIYKNIVLNYYYWDYTRTRIDFKVLVYLLYKNYVGYYKNKIYMKGYSIDVNMKYSDFLKGQISYKNLKAYGITWYPDDYVDDPSYSSVAKESDELDLVIHNIEKNKYFSLLNERLEFFSLGFISQSTQDENQYISADILSHNIEKNKHEYQDKMLIYTEGKTDVMHLENAWKNLYCNNHNFKFVPFEGIAKIAQYIINLPKDMRENYITKHPILIIVDSDKEGRKLFNTVCEQITPNIGKVNTLDNHYVILLPTPKNNTTENIIIEFLYDFNILDKYGVIEYQKPHDIINFAEKNSITSKELSEIFFKMHENQKLNSLQYYHVIDNKKTSFANQIKNDNLLRREDFKNFEQLFNCINNFFKESFNESIF